jgi:hypothetical protein
MAIGTIVLGVLIRPGRPLRSRTGPGLAHLLVAGGIVSFRWGYLGGAHRAPHGDCNVRPYSFVDRFRIACWGDWRRLLFRLRHDPDQLKLERESMQRDARILIAADQSIADATPEALRLLEMTFEQLRSLPPGGLSLERDREGSKEFESAWNDAGRSPVIGSGTIRLLDGRLIRIQYFIVPQPDGGFEIVFDVVDEPLDAPSRMYAVGDILAAWRAAERTLAQLDPESNEWVAAQAAIAHFRGEYRRLVTDKGGPALAATAD